MSARAILTVGFSGFDSNSLWFPPADTAAPEIGEGLFEGARAAVGRAKALIEVGCSVAEKERPDLAAPLRALARASLETDFFDFSGHPGCLGWFRVSASAPGATPEAMAACEEALKTSRAPLMAAQVEGKLAGFAGGATDEVPAAFVGAALAATAKMSEAFAQADLGLGSADFFRLESRSGRRLVACVQSCAQPGDGLADIKTFAKLAQASMEARRGLPPTPETDAFFDAVDLALGSSVDSPPLRRREIGLPADSFFHAPTSIHAVDIAHLPAEGFDQGAKALLLAVARRFGSIAASPKGMEGDLEGKALSAVELCALGPFFAKLSAGPAPSAPTARPSAGSLGL